MTHEEGIRAPALWQRAIALLVAISLEGSTLGTAALASKPIHGADTERRRLDAVAQMRKETGADPAKVAALHQKAAVIESNHLGSRLYGLAQAEAELRAAVQKAGKPGLSYTERREAFTQLRASAAAVGAGAAKVESILKTPEGARTAPKGSDLAGKLKLAKKISAAVTALPPSISPKALEGSAAQLTGKLTGLLAKAPPPRKKPFRKAPAHFKLTAISPRVRQASLDDLNRMHPKYASTDSAFHVASMLSELDDGALTPPTAQDLQASPQAPLTPAIAALAKQLGNDPVQIYEYVRQNIASEPYFGSKKGALGALAEGIANDYDQASLLVALLRSAGVPARYETGQVLLTVKQALDFTNTNDPMAAVTVMDTIGMSATANLDQNNLIDSVVLDQHAWVRAYVPYTNYRGSNAPGSRSVWVRLDTSIKNTTRTPPVFAVGSNVTFDFGGYLAGTTPMSTVQSPLQVYQTQIAQYLQANGLNCDSLDQLLPTNPILSQPLRLLPSELGTQLLESESVVDSLDPSTDYGFTVDFDGTTSTLQSLSANYGQLIALRYTGTGNVTETLKVGGQVVWTGDTIPAGTPQTLTVTVNTPGLGQAVMTHDAVAGSIYALGLADSHPTDAQLAAVKALAPAASAGGAPQGDIDEDNAEALAFSYLHHIDRDEKNIFGYAGDVGVKDVTEILAGHVVSSSTFFGVPVSSGFSDWQIDVQREANTPFAQNNDNSGIEPVNELAGFQGSHWENRIFQEVFNSPGVSTTNGLQIAAAQGIPLLTLTAPGQSSQLSGYSDDSINEIEGALGQGEVATVPQHPYSYAAAGLSGLETYLLLDPVVGTAEYREGSSFNGAEALLLFLLSLFAAETPDSDTSCQCGSIENLVDGNYFFPVTDLTLPAVGIPIAFTRSYDSLGNLTGVLGTNWFHSYERKLIPNSNGSVTFVTAEGQEIQSLTFTYGYNPATYSTGFISPAGWNLTLTGSPSAGYTLTHKDGTFSLYDGTGKLVSDNDLNGNTVTLTRNADGTVNTVIDAAGRTALTFGYTSGQLTQVTDASGRTVGFGQTGGNLTSATDVLGQVETYAYDGQSHLTGRTDKNGNTWSVAYDANGRWDQETDPAGNTESASYDNQGQATVFTDKRGEPQLTTYNSTGNPLSVTDPSGNTKTSTWDANFDKLMQTDGRGNTTTYTYDTLGNPTSQTDPDYGSYSWVYGPNSRPTTIQTPIMTTTNAYDANGNLLTSKNGSNNTTTYTYLPTGQLATVLAPGNTTATSFAYNADGTTQSLTDPTGAKTSFAYDGAGHLTQLTDPAGHTRSLVVDARGQVQSMKDALGNQTSFTYDAIGNRLSLTDPSGAKTAFVYDGLNRLTTTTDAQNHVWTTGYDPNGNVLARTDANGHTSTFAYDQNGRMITMTDALGNVSSQGFCADLSSSPCEQVDPNGNVTKQTYDKVGRPITVTNGAGQTTSTAYNGGGQVTLVTDANQNTTTSEYDPDGRLSYVVTRVSNTSYSYDARGNRASVTSATGGITSYTYDANNRLLTETNPLSQVTTYTYNPDGTRATKLDANGHTTTYAYDANKRLTGVTFADGSSYAFQYDSRGHRTQEQSAAELRTLAYDSLGRLQTAFDTQLEKTITYGYDPTGNRTTLAFDGVSYAYTYDADNRLTQVIDPDGEATDLTYDPGGRRTELVQGNGVATNYAYDQANRTTSIVNAIQPFAYAYDPVGNPYSKTFSDGTKEQYGYDAANRLTSVVQRNGVTANYSLDPSGNRSVVEDIALNGTGSIPQELTTNHFDQTTSIELNGATAVTVAYDNNGNRISESAQAQTYPAPPPVLTTYNWNDDDRLASVQLPSGQTDAFLYDANGIRVGKSDSTGSVRYLLDGGSVVATYDPGSGARLAVYNQNPQKIDEVFSYKTAQGAKYYPHTDMLGSVTALSDSTGTSQATWTYDVYGTRTQTSGTLTYAFGFTGREHDADTGLIYSRQRYYDPSVGSWLSPDRKKMVNGPNEYQYVGDRPTLLTDPSGNDAWSTAADIAYVIALVAIITAVALIAWEVATPLLVPLIWSSLPQIEEEVDEEGPQIEEWVLGAYKSATTWANQMASRGWTSDLITKVLNTGNACPAPNQFQTGVNAGNAFMQYTDPETGLFLVLDTVTNEIIQLSGPNFVPLSF